VECDKSSTDRRMENLRESKNAVAYGGCRRRRARDLQGCLSFPTERRNNLRRLGVSLASETFGRSVPAVTVQAQRGV